MTPEENDKTQTILCILSSINELSQRQFFSNKQLEKVETIKTLALDKLENFIKGDK